MKTCCKCQRLLPLDSFAWRRIAEGTRQAQCKECQNAWHKANGKKPEVRARKRLDHVRWRDANPERAREIQDKSIAKRKAAGWVPKKADPHKVWARAELNKAVGRGELARPDECPKCGKPGKVWAHHHDYDKPFDVEWSCPKCHMRTHHSKVSVP